MDYIVTIVIIIVLLVGWTVWGFVKYKSKERMAKNEIYSYINDGLLLPEAIKKSLMNVKEYTNLNLDKATINKVGDIIASLSNRMNIDNVIEIYSTFIHRYIYRDGRNKKADNIEDKKIIYAVENLELNERNGYFVIQPDKGDDWDKKYNKI